ncbi:MAG TPA: hypothetical protein VMZ11_07855 [Mycobacteriales bacterium]|nr:hypothetical protein [Mycobacteriales bacterium]
MGLFRRRRRGRHELGGAVVDLPSAPPPLLFPAEVQLRPGIQWPLPVQPRQEPRVELGFRDGSAAALAPDSAQARALVALAEALVQRD